MPPAAATGIAPVETPSYSMLFSPAASSLASPSVELQVHWEPAQIRSELRMATTILSHRGLKLAAKWTSEQLVGLVRTDGTMDSSTAGGEIAMKGLHAEMTQLQDRDWYAKSLLELGEYLHAAAVLSQPNDDVTCMTPPLEDASSYGIYLRAYALYLAGERRKEQDYLELQRYERIYA
jgi:anaphase-promoting complex subunit 8